MRRPKVRVKTKSVTEQLIANAETHGVTKKTYPTQRLQTMYKILNDCGMLYFSTCHQSS